MTRLLIVSQMNVERPYGESTRPQHLGAALSELGFDVRHVGISVPPGQGHLAVHNRSLRAYVRAIRSAVRDFAPVTIYAHQNLAAVAGVISRTVPVLADFHSLPSLEWKHLVHFEEGPAKISARVAAVRAELAERFVIRGASAVIAAGEELATDIRHIYRNAPLIHIVPNGIPDEFLNRTTTRRPGPLELPGAHALAVLPTASTMSNVYAAAFLDKVATHYRGLKSPVTFHVLGASAKEVVMDRGSQVLHHGFQRDLLQWIDHADVCLLPYPEEAALFGGARNKLLEFVARAKRIVTTVEGLRGLSQIDGWDGVTVTSDSPVEFAAAIEMAISGSTFSHVRDDALEGWSWRASANSLSRHLSVGESDPRELAATHLR